MTFPRRGASSFATIAAAGLILAGCGSDGRTGDGAAGDRPTVLASFYPLAYLAERIAGPDAVVENLTAPGVEPHDLELTGQQVGAVSDADLVVYLHGFQPAVDEAVTQNARDRAIDVAEMVGLLAPDEHEDEGHEDEGHEDEGHEDEGHDEHAHDLEGDPHVWLDPTNLVVIADAVADRLGELVPDRAGDFDTRAGEFVAELDQLDEEYTSSLASCERRIFVTSHAAFGYLANRYDLEMVGISGLSPEAEPSPARVAEVQNVISGNGVTTIFYERLVSPAVAEALAGDLGVQTAVLDPIEGLTDDTANEDYFGLMRANLDALEEANGCR